MRAEAITVSRRALAWALAAVGLLTILFRVWALDFSLPGFYHPDEVFVLNRALAFAKGGLNPHNFLYPTLYFYVLFAWEGLFFVAGYVAGVFSSMSAFQDAYFREAPSIVIAARACTAACGALTVAATYRFGARLYGPFVGAASALFLAVAPFAVRDAHYIKLDVPVGLPATLTLAALARIVVDPIAAARRRSWIIAGGLAGLTVSTHYYAAVIVLSIVAAAIADVPRSGRWQRSFQLLLWAALASIVGFWIGSPFLPFELPTAIRDMVAVREIDIDRAVAGKSAFVELGAYIRMLATDAIGWPVAAAAVIGLVLALAHDWRRGLLLASFPLAFLAFCANTVPMSRYLNVMLPAVAVAGAFGIAAVTSRAGSSARAIAIGAVVLAAVPGLAGSIRSDSFFAEPDTRAVARAYVEREIPSGATIAMQPQSVPVTVSRESLVEALRTNLGSETRASVKFQHLMARTPYPSPSYRILYFGDTGFDPPPNVIYISPRRFDGDAGLSPLREAGVQYVVLKRTDVPNPAFAALTAALQREGRLIATFSPYRSDVDEATRATVPPYMHNTATRIHPALERPGPIVDLWKVG